VRGFKDYISKKLAMLSLAMANVEKNSLSQKGGDLENNTNHEVSVSQGTLLQALIRGEITQEVRDLRWRMYKVDEASKKIKTKIIGRDEFGNNIIETYEYDESKVLAETKLDSDDYKLIMIFKNEPSLNTFSESIDNIGNIITDKEIIGKYKEASGDYKINEDEPENDDNEAKPLGIVTLNSANETINIKYPLIVDREHIYKYDIENFVEKVYIREINNEEFLIELLVQETPDPNRENSKSLIKDLNKSIENISFGGFLNINKLMFVTNKTIGSPDNRLFEYEILNLEKISKFNGYFLIKYKAKVLINGKNLLAEFVEEELEEKYKNKESKNKK
jgi:hypothetical protein